ncbi:MAG: DNA mismatch repair protein MutS [Acidobacteriia bacterium]|nr:DNA mismatch repair protein MutS [Terriglobia bacterium]
MSSLPPPDPRAEYVRRLEVRRRAAAREAQLEIRIGNLRLGVFIAAVAIAWLSFRSALLSSWWLLLPLLVFLSLLILHERVRRARRRLERAAAYYERGIARLENRWAGTGEPGDRFLDKSHPYAEDLDLFGRGSLFELVCTARTRAGEETLARWLTAPATPEDILARQAAVEELRGRLDLREGLAILGTDVRAGVNPDALAAWGNAPPLLDSRRVRLAAALLASAAMITLVLWSVWGINGDLFLLVIFGEAVFTYCLRRRVRRVVEGVERPGQDLALLSQALARLEREPFTAPRLVALSRALITGGLPASRQIAGLDRLIVLLDSRRNLFFAPIAALLLWEVQMAFAIETWRRKSGPAVAQWLAVVGEMEALCALAGYAYEHPDDPFPEMAPPGPCFEGEGLGHPLLPERTCTRNDVRLCRDLRLLVVSGSNMSGKSTLLRTVGINAVLAQAGAPVRALRLKLSPLAVGASILRRDSLQEGTSRFYAEITRLRQLVDITLGPRPLLFLLDELLHGTNSHDRSIGAVAVIQDLVRRGAVGLLTTHDLALAQIAEIMAPRAENFHFEDFMENGRLVFDYRLRPGIVRKSNALELMRSVGLQI